ncbi:MAG: carboxypeptidase-like regulatory domain-containing protein [Terriglobia bacterium]
MCRFRGGAVSGSVKDAGGAMPNAKISIMNVATGAATVIVSDAGGSHAAPNLRPGTHDTAVRLLVYES